MPYLIDAKILKESEEYREKPEEKSNIIRIALDVDGVLRDFNSQMVKVYLKYYPSHASRVIPKPENWKLDMQFPIGKRIYPFMYEHAKEIFLQAPPIPDAIDAYKTLRKAGFHILVISSQREDIQKYTTKWLENNHIYPDELYYTEDKFKYVGYFDYIVEDNPKHIINISEAEGKVIIFGYDYNKNIPLDIELSNYRANNWKDVVKYLLKDRLDEPLIQKLDKGW